MIDCAQYRRSMLADPHSTDPQVREHRESCHDCTLYSERLLRFESRLERALRVGPASAGVDLASEAALSFDNVVPLRARSPRTELRSRKGMLAMAASVLVALVVAGGLWLSAPGASLAADVVTHMREEPEAWRRTDVPVPGSKLENVLRDSHLHLAASGAAGMVSYANSCGFRGHQVPHLVLQTDAGPVTVMVLVHEHVSKPAQFDEQGYRGVIVPVPGHGSLAVLTRGSATDLETVEHIAHRVLDSIIWTG
jgi:hypothetical protein